jgi:NAD(P)-dependent dehydrogenase (short-subunit alcohol dehydrogenase family)
MVLPVRPEATADDVEPVGAADIAGDQPQLASRRRCRRKHNPHLAAVAARQKPGFWSRLQAARWCEARLDQRDLAALRVAAESARVTFGRLDILFANAGIQSFKPILEWEDPDWHDQIDVNLTGTCNAIRAVALHLVKNGGGRIIVTSSTQGRHGTKYGAAYSASKWGIIGLMKSAALELGEHKITVNPVIPGLIDTPLTRHRQRYAQAVDDLSSQVSTTALEADAEKKLIAKSPLGVPWIEPEAIAPAVVFLASDEAYMVSGATYDVTGGDSANYTA